MGYLLKESEEICSNILFGQGKSSLLVAVFISFSALFLFPILSFLKKKNSCKIDKIKSV